MSEHFVIFCLQMSVWGGEGFFVRACLFSRLRLFYDSSSSMTFVALHATARNNRTH